MDTLFQHINIPAVARMLYNLTARYLFLICNYGKKNNIFMNTQVIHFLLKKILFA